MARSREPLLWSLFSAGGMLSALVLPVVVAILWVAAPLGWVSLPPATELASLAGHPATRLFVLALVTLCLFHWAHRFRYTLYDGLQLYHLEQLIALITYGVAGVLTLVTAYVMVSAF